MTKTAEAQTTHVCFKTCPFALRYEHPKHFFYLQTAVDCILLYLFLVSKLRFALVYYVASKLIISLLNVCVFYHAIYSFPT